MSWERDPLWAKARLFFERAFSEPRDGPAFGLWCSLGLELLARAALASISPTLLAEPDKDHKYLLHALKRGSERSARKSIGVTQALSLCRTLFPEFTESDYNVAVALTNRRNEELHSGGAAFEEYAAKQWLPGFYSACRSLSVGMGESLVTLFGEDEAGVAAEVLTEVQKDVKQRVLSSIAAHRKVFEERPQLEQETAKRRASELGIELSSQRHHRVNCPACGSVATVQGTPFGKEYVTHKDAEVLVKQAVSPNGFSCPACSLKLRGYAELDAAGLGGQHTRTTTFSPEEYYGLVPLDDLDRYLEDARSAGEEYDNEG
jgi:hypothetical protein